MIESKAAFARRLGVHKSQVTRAAQAGRLVLTADGRVEVEASVERWYATKAGRDDVAARHAAQRGAGGANAGAAGLTGQGAGANAANGLYSNPATGGATPAQPRAQPGAEPGARAQTRMIAVHYQNQAIKLDMALRKGLRYQQEAVRQEALALGATLRAALEHIVDQTAPLLAGTQTDLDRRRVLDAEFRRLRQTVNREFPRALRRMRAAGAAQQKGSA